MPNSVIPSITDSPFLSYHDNIGVEFFCDFAEGRKRSFHSGMKKWNRFLHLILDDLWDSVCKERKSRRFRITTFARLRLELMKKYYFHLEMNPLGIPEVSD
jgi:hypothetical protein